jgi:hypothetical protein
VPDDIEVETDKLREQVDEAREGGPPWLRYVGLSAAIFAVVAAVSALRAGDLINEALIHQMKASDTWAEFQASRQKQHIYSVATDSLIDRGSSSPRIRDYRAEIAKESAKQQTLAAQAGDLENESTAEVRSHHSFEYAVALLQVGIALGAVAALARSMPAWYVSVAAGIVGIFFFARGFIT